MELKQATDKLNRILDKQGSGGAFILSSPKGSGKKIFIRNIVESKLNTENLLSSNLLWVSEENNKILIDKVRSIYDFLSKTSYNDNARIVVIDPADALNIQSSNALLKILEDCNTNVYFFLLCNSIDSILRTVRSRCINIKMPQTQDALYDLEISEQEKELYLYISKGSKGLAKKMVELSAVDFYMEMLDVIEKFDSKISMLYKFLDKNFSKDTAEKNWGVFVNLFHHLMDRIVQLHLGRKNDLIEQEGRVIEKIAHLRDLERWDNVFSSIRIMMQDTKVCSLSMYNVALLSFFKIRMKKDVE